MRRDDFRIHRKEAEVDGTAVASEKTADSDLDRKKRACREEIPVRDEYFVADAVRNC